MISLSGVTKRYGAATAVQDLSFTVNSGETLGLLGQNGAGKTTTLNIITGYLAPTSGDVRVGDYDLLTQARQAKRLIGYLPEQPPLYDEMTVESYLRFVCRLRLVVEADIARHVRDIAAQTNLSDVLGRRVGNLSKGYRQRVGLAQALCGEPEVLVLDEPTVGLDPRQTAEFRDTLKKLSGGRTVIFSSHILSEVQALCDRVIILHHGRVACDQRLGDMSRGAGARLQAAIFGDMETLLPALRSLNSVARVTRLPAREAGVAEVLIEGKPGAVPQKELFTLLCGLQMPLMRLTPAADTLEDVFLRCTADDQALETKYRTGAKGTTGETLLSSLKKVTFPPVSPSPPSHRKERNQTHACDLQARAARLFLHRGRVCVHGRVFNAGLRVFRHQ